MRISDWSSDVFSSDLKRRRLNSYPSDRRAPCQIARPLSKAARLDRSNRHAARLFRFRSAERQDRDPRGQEHLAPLADAVRSEEHTSELQSLLRISYAVFCLKKTKYKQTHHS